VSFVPCSGSDLLAQSRRADCPSLDVTWVPDVRDTLALASGSFDIETVDCEGLYN